MYLCYVTIKKSIIEAQAYRSLDVTLCQTYMNPEPQEDEDSVFLRNIRDRSPHKEV
jgi:hypothetical protein